MKELAKLGMILMVISSLFGLVACGGGNNAAKDATAAEGEGKKELKKFEGNRMEVADEEDDSEEGDE